MKQIVRYKPCIAGLFILEEKNFAKIEKIFKKPLDKRKIFAIIKVQKERN